MQDLVRVGVADAAQQVGIGQGALQGVALGGERLPEGCQISVHHLQAAGIVDGERRLPLDQMEGGPLLPAGLVEQQGAGGEVEGGEADLPRDLGAARSPVQAARDHQVEHHE